MTARCPARCPVHSDHGKGSSAQGLPHAQRIRTSSWASMMSKPERYRSPSSTSPGEGEGDAGVNRHAERLWHLLAGTGAREVVAQPKTWNLPSTVFFGQPRLQAWGTACGALSARRRRRHFHALGLPHPCAPDHGNLEVLFLLCRSLRSGCCAHQQRSPLVGRHSGRRYRPAGCYNPHFNLCSR